ncbi:Os01g0215750 [Oryza sativa Japonica Group]|uniref:Os01g0215750 protein n=1 Tax=Oryza sativa subsp. japonica TaxID=39947 RepID=A0A0P0V0H7_ORYSJ|nr:Os01g0215750 [Oryza sativa Japonica Group]
MAWHIAPALDVRTCIKRGTWTFWHGISHWHWTCIKRGCVPGHFFLYACVAIGLCVRHMAWHIAPALDVRTCIKRGPWTFSYIPVWLFG